MRTLFCSLLAVGALAVPAGAHEIGDDVKRDVVETHDLRGFDKIDVEGVYLLDVEVGPDFSVRTEARQRDADEVYVHKKGDTLVLAQKNRGRLRSHSNTKGIRAVVTLPSLEEIDVSGIASGEIRNIVADDFEADIAGISSLHLLGRCDHLTIDVAGMGETDASGLHCGDVHASLGGMGKLSVYASRSVDADMGGMGKIAIYGNPKDRKTDKSPMSSIEFKD